MSMIFGLDFGTTNSALSINNKEKVTVVNIDKHNSPSMTLKSVLYFDEEEERVFVGNEAINRYIENDAYGRYIQSIKTFLPDKMFDDTEIYRKFYKLDDLVAIILRMAKEKGEEFIKKEVNSVVLGRPVVFSDNPDNDKLAEERLISAAKKAGFKNIYLQYEPIAAALAFENTLPKGEEKLVFVGDFGGGTSDFSVVKIRGLQNQKTDRKKDILSLVGILTGGDTFDSRVMWDKIANYFGKNVKVKSVMGDYWLPMPTHIINKLQQWHLIPLLHSLKIQESIRQIKYLSDNKKLIENLENLVKYNYGYMLFQSIEKAKCELSSLDSTIINFKEHYLTIKEKITRKEFEKIIKSEVMKIESCIKSTLVNAELTADDIDLVFLTGGSSHIPCIKRIFKAKFGCNKINQTNAFTSVAYGLGLTGSLYL